MADKTYVIGNEGALPLRVGLDDLNGDETVFAEKVSVEAIAGADSVAGVLKVEERFVGSGVKTASALIKTGPGFLHNINVSCNDSAPTAGRVDIYDNTAGSGTLIWSAAWGTTWFAPISVAKNVSFATGLYILITTSADVNVDVDYR